MAKAWGEFEYIDWIRRRLGTPSPDVIVGPGDDAALVRTPGDELALTTDMFTEGADFDLDNASARQVGAKAINAAASDIAAMAMRPKFIVVAVNLPAGTTRQLQEDLLLGIHDAAGRLGVELVGGDLSAGGDRLIISVTVTGVRGAGPPATRSGAEPEQKLFVTGTLGGSLVGRHLTATARIEEGLWLGENAEIGAMIDISDGLAQDLWHIADAGDVGAVVRADAVPVSEDARRLAVESGRSALEHALSDGEDFELLLSASPVGVKRIETAWPFETKITEIGWITREKGVFLETGDGRRRPLERSGWRHTFE